VRRGRAERQRGASEPGQHDGDTADVVHDNLLRIERSASRWASAPASWSLILACASCWAIRLARIAGWRSAPGAPVGQTARTCCYVEDAAKSAGRHRGTPSRLPAGSRYLRVVAVDDEQWIDADTRRLLEAAAVPKTGHSRPNAGGSLRRPNCRSRTPPRRRGGLTPSRTCCKPEVSANPDATRSPPT